MPQTENTIQRPVNPTLVITTASTYAVASPHPNCRKYSLCHGEISAFQVPTQTTTALSMHTGIGPPSQFVFKSSPDARLSCIARNLTSSGSPDPGVTRPLHYAISDCVQHDPAQLPQNLPAIELLLEAEADPRLPDLHGQSPIEELEAWLRGYRKVGRSRWEPKMLESKPFFEAALEALKKAALTLDGEHITHATILKKR